MVDFQSRDTRRGLDEGDGDDGADPEDEAESEPDDEAEAEPDDQPGSDAPADGDGSAADASAESVPDESPADDAVGDGSADGDDRRDHGGHDRRDHAGDDHHHHDLDTLGVAVVTVSSSRTLSDDPAGDTITETMEAADDEVVTRELIPDDYDRIEGTLDNLVGREDVDIVVTTGGTGVTPDDMTIEAAKRLFDKELPGFGELFRLLSYDEIGTKVVATRATAGIVDGVPVFCLPGSENAALLGAETIISKEAGHIAGLASRDE